MQGRPLRSTLIIAMGAIGAGCRDGTGTDDRTLKIGYPGPDDGWRKEEYRRK